MLNDLSLNLAYLYKLENILSFAFKTQNILKIPLLQEPKYLAKNPEL
jgi:hypothetical protein